MGGGVQSGEALAVVLTDQTSRSSALTLPSRAPPRPTSFARYAGLRSNVAQARNPRVFSICGRWIYHNRKTGAVACFSCKSWRCRGCGPTKKKNWVASITHRLQAWDRVRFWTLTLNPALVPEGEAPERFLQRAWRNLRAELAQRCPRCSGRMIEGACRKHPGATARPPSFVWVLEYTKAGTPHLHVAVDQYVPRGWIQKQWIRLTGAWNVDVRAVDAENVTTYLAKYLGKTLDTLQEAKRSKGEALAIKGLHVYGTSRDMVPFAPPAPNPEWELLKRAEDIEALLVPALQEDPPPHGQRLVSWRTSGGDPGPLTAPRGEASGWSRARQAGPAVRPEGGSEPSPDVDGPGPPGGRADG